MDGFWCVLLVVLAVLMLCFYLCRVIAYVIQRHLPGSKVSMLSGRLDWTLVEKGLEPSAGVTAYRLMEASLEKLGKQLRNLEGLALKVIAVQPLSAISRQTCAFFPQPHPLAGGPGNFEGRLPRCMEPIDVLVQLENSGGPGCCGQDRYDNI